MADVAAAPAPAAAADSSASNGATGAATATPTPKAAPANGTGPVRGPDDKFTSSGAPAPGAPSLAKPPAPGETTATEAQKLRVKGELKLYGKTESVDEELTPESFLRERQKLRMLEQKNQKSEERTRQAQQILELAEKDPDEFLRQLGKDPDVLAEERLAKRAKMSMMTEDQKAIYERDQKLAQYEARDAERKKVEAQQLNERREKMIIDRNRQEFAEVAEAHGLEKTYADLYRYADAKEKLMRASGGVPPTPAEIAKAVKIDLDKGIDRSIAALTGPALLKRLGPKVVANFAQALLEQHQQQHGFEPPNPVEAPTPVDEPRTYIDEYEQRRQQREYMASLNKK